MHLYQYLARVTFWHRYLQDLEDAWRTEVLVRYDVVKICHLLRLHQEA